MKPRHCVSVAVAGLLLFGGQQASVAQPRDPATTGAWGMQYGINSDVHRLSVNYETPALWSYRFSGSRIDLVGEFGVSYWRTRDDGTSRRSVWQASAIPMFQWWLSPRFYLEAGIGATVFNHAHFADRKLGSAFQFGDHLGLGYQLNEKVRLSLRASHFSNAGIKEPNDGLNIFQAGITVRW